MRAYVNGIPCTVYEFLDCGKICIVKYEEYPNLMPVPSSLIEVRDE